MVVKWWNILGIPSRYVDETYFNSIMEPHPYTLTDNSENSYSKVALIINSWRVPHEKEQK